MTPALIMEFHEPLSSPNPSVIYDGLWKILTHAFEKPMDALFLADVFYPPLASLHMNWAFELAHPDFDLFFFSELAQRSERTHRYIWLHAVRSNSRGPRGKWIAGVTDRVRPYFRHRVLLLCRLAIIADTTFDSLGHNLLDALLERASAELEFADPLLTEYSQGPPPAGADPFLLSAYATVLEGIELLATKQAHRFPEHAIQRFLEIFFRNPLVFATRLLTLAARLLAARLLAPPPPDSSVEEAARVAADTFQVAAGLALDNLRRRDLDMMAASLNFLQDYVEPRPDCLGVEDLRLLLGFRIPDECTLPLLGLFTSLFVSAAGAQWYDACIGGSEYLVPFWEFMQAASNRGGHVRRAVCSLLAILAGETLPGEPPPQAALAERSHMLRERIEAGPGEWVPEFVISELAGADQTDVDAVSAGLLAVRGLARASDAFRDCAINSRDLRETIEEIRPFRQNDEAFTSVSAFWTPGE
jgi:hypothetical protein